MPIRTAALALIFALGAPLAVLAQDEHDEPEVVTYRNLTVEQWREALNRPAAVDRRRAARLMRGCDHPAFIPLFKSAIVDEDAIVRFHVIEVLRRYGRYAQFAIEPMSNMLLEVEEGRQPAEHARACFNLIMVLGVLAKANLPAILPFLSHQTLGKSASEACYRIGPTSLDPLIKRTGHESPLVRRWAASALGKLGSQAEDAVPALIASLGDPEPTVRQEGILALANIGEPAWEASLPAILTLLAKDPAAAVRGQAAVALATFQPPQVEALVEALADPVVGVRVAATNSLGAHKALATPAVDALCKLYGATKEESDRKAVVRALYRIRSTKALPTVIRVLRTDPNPSLRSDAINLLSLLGAGTKEEVTVLTDALLKDAEPRVRAAAALALGKLRVQSARDALRKAVGDPHKRVQNCARHALRQLDAAKKKARGG